MARRTASAPRSSKMPAYWAQATQALAARDPVLARIIAGTEARAFDGRGNAFQTLARSIVGQQISVKAAASVWHKFSAEVAEVTPEIVAAHAVERLRACGLSRSKVAYLKDLSAHFIEHKLNPHRWAHMSDDELVAELMQVKGIGRWTAEMFLIFHLMRPDVFPLADLGLQKAMRLHYARGRALSERKIQTLSKLWTPYRSVATWYLWRSLDPIPVEY